MGNITISGTPTDSGTFNNTVTLTGGCGAVTANRTMVVDNCLGINDETSNNAWSIYPNPSQGQCTIQSSEGGKFELLDSQERIINSFELHGKQASIHVSLSAGIYFICEQNSGTVQKLLITD